MGEFIVRALFLAHKLLLVSFLSFFNKVFESEVKRELLLRRLYHLFHVQLTHGSMRVQTSSTVPPL